MLTGPSKGDRSLVWTPDAETAFTQIKDAFADATLLVHPQLDAPMCLLTDASDVAVTTTEGQFGVVADRLFLMEAEAS